MSIKTQANQSFVTLQYETAQKNKVLSKGHIKSDTADSTKTGQEDLEDGDSLTISNEGMEKQQKTEEAKSLLEQYEEQIESGKEAAKAFGDMAKMMEIARRIANGDKVPAKDEQKLMEFNSDLYQAAKSASVLNENKKHKSYKTMFEDEEEAQNSDESVSKATDTESGEVPETETVETEGSEMETNE